ncbi:MAG: hypothetical protein V2I33_22775, partial [Kangiellaceae bacterium]|nr:hypothetical protein [Kangiellaceae bacterium]
VIGLTNLSATIRAASAQTQKQIMGLVASTFSEGFIVDGTKHHYTYGIEGVDPTLIRVVQDAFFDVY